MIIGVAIKHGDLVVALPAPNRHNSVIAKMAEIGLKPPFNSGLIDDQGFYLEDGTYLTRSQAKIHAIKEGQCTKDTYHDTELFSEDLW